MSESERERLVQDCDDAWENERVAWGAVRGAKQAVVAAEVALEEARVAYADELEKCVAADAALSKYDETHHEGGR